MQDVQAIVVAIAILDAKSRKTVTSADIQTIASKLTDSSFGNVSPATSTPPLMAQTWAGKINPANFTGTLANAVKNVRIYQRTFYLSSYIGNP